MSTDPLLSRARGLWQELAVTPVSFGASGDTSVVVSPRSRICPPGWVGIVLLGGAAIVTAPDEGVAVRIRSLASGRHAAELLDPAVVGQVLPIGTVLGSAALAYRAGDGSQPVLSEPELRVEELAAGHPDVVALESASGPEDADEAVLSDITSSAFVVRREGRVVAAAGYRVWPSRTGHLSVLTDPDFRGRGLARVTGAAAVRHALARDLLPQWRARVPASRRVAAGLGFRELGFQLSLEVV